jgi:predicted site-specific integrase-resolvase
VIDHDGHEWLTVADAAQAVRVLPRTIRVWTYRGKVRAHTIGRTRWVHLGDVRHAESQWRRRAVTTR